MCSTATTQIVQRLSKPITPVTRIASPGPDRRDVVTVRLDLRLCCYDLTSTYFETDKQSSESFPSRRFGYSRDKWSDRPQVVIGLLVTGDGIPIAHHVFAGNTADVTTLPAVMADYQERFGTGRIALVADRGLIWEDNVAEVAAAGFDHVLATRLHDTAEVQAALEAARQPDVDVGAGQRCELRGVRGDVWRPALRGGGVAAAFARDNLRREQLSDRIEEKLIALAARVNVARSVTRPRSARRPTASFVTRGCVVS